MSHAIHSIQGIIIDDRVYTESGRILFILTPDLGIVTLLAQGVREQKSKLRGLLSLGTVANFEFVEGREVKRLTTILPIKKFDQMMKSIPKRNLFSKTVQFLERVIVGETENHNLYERFLEGLECLEKMELAQGSRQDENCSLLELLLTINLLEALGYWSGVEYLGFGEDVFAKVKADKEHLLKQVNASIESTHL